MIGLSDSQLEIIMSTAEPMAEEKCQEFLKRVAAVLQVRGQINDDDVSAAVQLALRALIHNSAVWKEWNRNSLPMCQNGEGLSAPLADPHPALETRRAWRLLPGWSTILPLFATGLGALCTLGRRRRQNRVSAQ
jgi:hypothetical protein